MCAAHVLLPPVNTFSVSLLEHLPPWKGAVTRHQVQFRLNEKMELFHAFIGILVINSDLERSQPNVWTARRWDFDWIRGSRRGSPTSQSLGINTKETQLIFAVSPGSMSIRWVTTGHTGTRQTAKHHCSTERLVWIGIPFYILPRLVVMLCGGANSSHPASKSFWVFLFCHMLLCKVVLTWLLITRAINGTIRWLHTRWRVFCCNYCDYCALHKHNKISP